MMRLGWAGRCGFLFRSRGGGWSGGEVGVGEDGRGLGGDVMGRLVMEMVLGSELEVEMVVVRRRPRPMSLRCCRLQQQESVRPSLGAV